MIFLRVCAAVQVWWGTFTQRLCLRLREERGDVPGWVLVTGMTVGLVMVIWAVARTALQGLLTRFLSGIGFG